MTKLDIDPVTLSDTMCTNARLTRRTITSMHICTDCMVKFLPILVDYGRELGVIASNNFDTCHYCYDTSTLFLTYARIRVMTSLVN